MNDQTRTTLEEPAGAPNAPAKGIPPLNWRIPEGRGGMRAELLLICLAGAVLFAPALWNRDLWNPLETLYGEVAREIVDSGDWLTLHQNGDGYYNKPPVFFWLAAAGIKAFGVTAGAVRLPSVVLGIGSLLLCYFIARRLRINPLVSSLVLATNWEFFTACQRATIDVTLTFFILLSFHLYLLSIECRRWWPYCIGALLAAGAAVLCKGPVALMVLACGILPYLAWRRQWRQIFHWRWIAALAAVSAIGLAWFIPAWMRQGDRLYVELFHGQVLSRMTSDWIRSGPVYYYLANFPGMFLPWFLFMPFAIWYAWKRRTERSFQALLWFAAGFVAFSAFPPKWSRYLIPLYPAAAMVVADYITMKRTRLELAALAMFPIAAVAAAVVLALRPGAAAYGLAFAVPVLAVSVPGLIFWRKLGYRALIGVAGISLAVFSVTLYPYENPRRSTRPIAEFLERNAEPGGVQWYESYEPGVLFYLNRAGMPVLSDNPAQHETFFNSTSGAPYEEVTYSPSGDRVVTFRVGRADHSAAKAAPIPRPGEPAMRQSQASLSLAQCSKSWLIVSGRTYRDNPKTFAGMEKVKSFPLDRSELLILETPGGEKPKPEDGKSTGF